MFQFLRPYKLIPTLIEAESLFPTTQTHSCGIGRNLNPQRVNDTKKAPKNFD